MTQTQTHRINLEADSQDVRSANEGIAISTLTPHDFPSAKLKSGRRRRRWPQSRLTREGSQRLAPLAPRSVAVILLVVTSLLVTACGSGNKIPNTPTRPPGSAVSPSSLSTAWSLPGADLQNTRDVGGPINASSVSTLGVAWTDPITATGQFGGYATTPVVSGGVMYTQDLNSDVEAINLQSGKVLWTTKYNSANPGPNGVTFADGTLFGTTATSAFALQAATGKQIWIKKLTRNGNEGIDMPPGYHNGTVYVSTVPGNASNFYVGDGQAILWALDASTGATRWKWDEVPTNLWSSAHTHINAGGGQWYPPTFDGHGNLYVGVANPAPFPGTTQYPWGSSRPGPDLYTDSIVKLDENTGKLLWYYQLTPHDLYDWDMENSPILSSAGGQQLVIDGGKAGILVAVNAQTGKLVWKRSVGVHDGHDNDNLYAEDGQFSKLHTPETVEPGDFGGIEAPLASNGTTVFAAVNNLSETDSRQGIAGQGFAGAKLPPFSTGTGDLVAVNEATGRVEWDDKLPSSPYGAVTLANDVVFTTTFNGTLYAFNASTGAELWHTGLSSGTNAPVAVVGDTVLTAASFPGPTGHGSIIAYRLGAHGTLPAATTKPPAATTTPPAASAAPPAKPGVQISTRTIPGLGPVLVNAQGRALYMFVPDNDKKVTCVGSCAEVWPPVFLPSGQKPIASGQVKQSLLGSDPDPAGGQVITYAGWPLYTFVSDTAPGKATGQGLNINGGLWYVISPSGGVIKTSP
jgi:outer membrane protein assembly factor BamB/predicted lipoprotein with Yx(FWY)xxD motif